MSISLSTDNLKRYKDIVWLLIKYGRSDIVKQSQLEELIQGDPETSALAHSEAKDLAKDLEKLGPTFIKLGQLLSSRSELFPPEYIEALARLQDKIEPFSFGEVEKIVVGELGLRISKAFLEFEAQPLAAASLGQVHRAVMRDGRVVAVKVQRPGIREQIAEDLQALETVTKFLDQHTQAGRRYLFSDMQEEFRNSLLSELDYRQEARNLRILRRNLEAYPRIIVPEPVDDYTTQIILTMDFVSGKKVTSLGPLARIDLEGEELAEQLFAAYLQQILVDGFFHADPHPGNVFLTDDRQIALLDLGMIGRIPPRMRQNLMQLVLAVSEGRGEEVATIITKIGQVEADFDELTLNRKISAIVAHHHELEISEMQVGRTVLNLARIAGDCHVRVPAELTLLGKTLLNLDQIGSILDPQFDPNAAVRRNALEIMRKNVLNSVTPSNLFNNIVELKQFAEQLPGRFNKLLDAAANNQLRLKVDAIDEVELIAGMHKIANRITLGLILAALIVGAAMMMRVETTFRLFGYPGFAILFFLVAALGAVALVGVILWTDHTPRK